MTKGEVLAKLKESGLLNKFTRDSGGLWEQAFKLYNESHPHDKKGQGCGHCYRTVSAWIQS